MNPEAIYMLSGGEYNGQSRGALKCLRGNLLL